MPKWLNRLFLGDNQPLQVKVPVVPPKGLADQVECYKLIKWSAARCAANFDEPGVKGCKNLLKTLEQEILNLLPVDFPTAVLRILVRYGFDISELLELTPDQRRAELASKAHKVSLFLIYCFPDGQRPAYRTKPITPIEPLALLWWIIGLGKGLTNPEESHLEVVARELGAAINRRELAGRQITPEEMSEWEWDTLGQMFISIFMSSESGSYMRSLLDIYCELGPEGEAFVHQIIFGQSDQNPES